MKKVTWFIGTIDLLSVVHIGSIRNRERAKINHFFSQTTTSSEVKTDASSGSERRKKKKKKKWKKMDLEAIANGDYSSIAGVWQSKGNKLVFNDKGWYHKSLRAMELLWRIMEQHQKGIYGGRDGASCWSIFLREAIEGDQVDDQGQVVFKDTSDASKNRL